MKYVLGCVVLLLVTLGFAQQQSQTAPNDESAHIS